MADEILEILHRPRCLLKEALVLVPDEFLQLHECSQSSRARPFSDLSAVIFPVLDDVVDVSWAATRQLPSSSRTRQV